MFQRCRPGNPAPTYARQQSERFLQYFTVITFVKSLTHARLLINHVIGMVKDIGKRRAEQSGMVAVKWVLIEFYNAADGVTESFRRDGAPVGATAANILITLDNRDARTLLNQPIAAPSPPGPEPITMAS